MHESSSLLINRSRGTVSLEFLIAAPVVVVVSGIIVQLGLIHTGAIVAEHSAGAASRSVAVGLDGKSDQGFKIPKDALTRARLRLAAGLSGVSPAANASGTFAQYSAVNAKIPGPWHLNDIADRAAYAELTSTLEVDMKTSGKSAEHAPAVRAEVAYPFLLTIPRWSNTSTPSAGEVLWLTRNAIFPTTSARHNGAVSAAVILSADPIAFVP